jgi:hypothetical protein
MAELVICDCDGVLVDSDRISLRIQAERISALGLEMSSPQGSISSAPPSFTTVSKRGRRRPRSNRLISVRAKVARSTRPSWERPSPRRSSITFLPRPQAGKPTGEAKKGTAGGRGLSSPFRSRGFLLVSLTLPAFSSRSRQLAKAPGERLIPRPKTPEVAGSFFGFRFM